MSFQKRKVLFIIWSFSYGGGAERVLSYFLSSLEATGRYEIDLLEICHFDIGWEPLPASVTVLPPVIDETAQGFGGRASRFLRRRLMRANPFLLRELVRGRKQYDLVVAFNYQLPTFFVRPCEHSISWNHGSVECLARDSVAFDRQRQSYAYMDRIVAIADRTRKSIVDLFPEVSPKCEIVHNGFPVDDILRRAQEPNEIELAPLSLIAVGRLDDNKRPEMILEAFRSIAERDAKVHLYYIGEGSHENEVKRLAALYHLEARVHLLGYQPNPYPLISQASCIISMSESEGFQSIFIEGMLLGVPFISTSAGAAEELSVDGKFGKVIGGPDEAAAAFGELVPVSSAMRDEMRRFAAGFTPESQVRAFERIAEEILGDGGRE